MLIQNKLLNLHSQIRNQTLIGAVAQLNRASDYGSEGFGFESQQRHKTLIGAVAQLNRASDYGSEGFGFESQQRHNIANSKYMLFAISFIPTIQAYSKVPTISKKLQNTTYVSQNIYEHKNAPYSLLSGLVLCFLIIFSFK